MANQMTTYNILFAGISLMFYFMGLVPTNPLLDILFRPDNFANATLFDYAGVKITLAALLTVAAAVAIAVSFFVRYPDLIVKATLISVYITLSINFVAVFVKLAIYNIWIAILLFSPLLYNYFFVILPDWWSGRD